MLGPCRATVRFALALLFLAGVGFPAALMADAMATGPSNSESDAVLEPLRVSPVSLGHWTRIHLRNRKVVTGSFRGLEIASDSVYAAEWTAWRARGGAGYRLPALGESVRLVRGRQNVTGRFAGFEPFAVRLAAAESSPSRVFSLSGIDSMVGGSASVNAATLTEMFKSSVVPQLSRVLVETRHGTQHVPVESIATTDTVHNHAILILGLLALGAVATLVGLIIATPGPFGN